jgi:hypothetical protein
MAFPAYAQEPPKVVSPVPADRRVDTYAAYSAVLAHLSRGHLDENKKYLIVELSGTTWEDDPQSCLDVPAGYRNSFAELLVDRSGYHLEQFRLERAFNVPKPYDLVTADRANQFRALRDSPGHTTNEVELFRGAADLITLGNVYFDRKRTLAAVYTFAFCGGLCGSGSWSVFVKNGKGEWAGQPWTTCRTVAASRGFSRPPGFHDALLLQPFPPEPAERRYRNPHRFSELTK